MGAFGVEKSFKKADEYTNLLTVALSTLSLLMSLFIDSWTTIFLPTLIIFGLFFIVMRLKIIHEEDPIKGFKYRMILCFGLTILGFFPIISYFGFQFIDAFLRNYFGPPLHEIIAPEELVNINLLDYNWGFFLDSLTEIPLLLQFGLTYFFSKKIGAVISSNVSKENKKLGSELEEINRKILYFSENRFSNYFIILYIFWLLFYFGIILSQYYTAILVGSMENYFIGLLSFLIINSPFIVSMTFMIVWIMLFSDFLISEKYDRHSLAWNFFKIFVVICFYLLWYIIFPDILAFHRSLIG
ncbi:MAG: hypothetical protein NUK63_03420 [Candidatus Bathyarchaeum tardum]|nr:MAG: hypothetical protein NUK63_03420 [Candidatus Bathyarchaeum tardum]